MIKIILLFLFIISLIFLFFFRNNFSIIIFSYPLLISFFVINLLTYLSFVLPLFSFIFAISISCFLMFFSLPFSFVEKIQKKLLLKILLFLYKTCILDFLAVIHIKFFFIKSSTFYKRLFCIFCLSLMHILLSRWYFFQKTFYQQEFTWQIQSLIFLFLFIGIAISYFRFLLNFSSFVIPLAVQNTPYYLSSSVLYVFGENNNDNNETSLPKKTYNDEIPAKKFSLFNINYSKSYYRQYSNSTHNSTFKYVGFCVGFCAMGAAVVTALYSKEQAQYAKEQAQYAKEQAYDTRREADAAAVNAGLLTKDEYWRRHPQDAAHKPPKKEST